MDYLPNDTEVFPGLGMLFEDDILSDRARTLLPASAKYITPTPVTPTVFQSAKLNAHIPRIATLFVSFFFVYGGVEASITGWLPSYSIRAGATGLLTGQWMVSILWIGLAGGRLATPCSSVNWGSGVSCNVPSSALELPSLQ